LPYTYEYPRPSVTVDIAVFARPAGGDLSVLLIQRKHPPFEGSWALPGGFVDKDEALEAAAVRELFEETGLAGLALEQVRAFGAPGRDPRGHTVSVLFVTQIDAEKAKVVAGDDAAKAEWHAWSTLKLGPGGGTPLAFDHGELLQAARAKLGL
jgi:8-oxo-dGTP diphosphatase